MTTVLGAAGIYSDDFAGVTFPDPAASWTKRNETGGAAITQTGYGTADAFAQFSIPGGTAYEQFTTVGGLCLEQACSGATAFTLTAKVETLPSVNGQEVGLYVVNTAETQGAYIALYYSGGGLNAFSTNFITNPTPDLDVGVSYTAPAYLRLSHDGGDSFTCAASDTGAFGGEQNTVTFNRALLDPAKVGIYCGSFNDGGIPAFTTQFDYVFESSAVISPEDDIPATTRRVMVIT